MDIVDGKTNSGNGITEDHPNDGDFIDQTSAVRTHTESKPSPEPECSLFEAPPPPKRKLMNGQNARTELIWFPEWVLGHGKISTEDRDWNCTAHHSQKDEWELPYICPI